MNPQATHSAQRFGHSSRRATANRPCAPYRLIMQSTGLRSWRCEEVASGSTISIVPGIIASSVWIIPGKSPVFTNVSAPIGTISLGSHLARTGFSMNCLLVIKRRGLSGTRPPIADVWLALRHYDRKLATAARTWQALLGSIQQEHGQNALTFPCLSVGVRMSIFSNVTCHSRGWPVPQLHPEPVGKEAPVLNRAAHIFVFWQKIRREVRQLG